MAPRLRCFVHFDVQMCFAPQRRAIFPDRNFQNGSEIAVFCAFWRWKCASRHSGVPFFRITTSKMAPGMRCFVHFELKMCFAPQRRAIFHSSSQQLPPHPPLYRGYFSNSRNHESLKNTAIRDVPNISRTCIFSPDCCTTWLLCYSAFRWLDCCGTLLFYTTFQLSILSEVSNLNFLR